MTTTTANNQEIIEVALDRILANPWQPRSSMDPDYIAELAEDIHNVGLLQEPMARPAGDGVRYQLAFGHTRVEALRLLQGGGRWEGGVRVKVKELTDEEMAYIALSENRARKNLTPLEEIRACARAIQEIDGITVQSLADRVGVDRSTMSNNLRLLRLPVEVLDKVESGDMSVRAARELLCLVNDDHVHDDVIAAVLKDLGGHDYETATHVNFNAPDYRFRTVRESIKKVVQGRHAYTWVASSDEIAKGWRPLFDRDAGEGGRSISFDIAAFTEEHKSHVHLLPNGAESGGLQWTCAAREWGRWSSRASRELNQGVATAEGQEGEKAKPVGTGANASWWMAVKKDPVVREVAGKRLKSIKSPADFTPEEKAALGTRIERPNYNNAYNLPQVAQPKEVKISGYDNAPTPPGFDFSQCAFCTTGASWYVDWDKRARLVCANREAWQEKEKAGVESWIAWRDEQMRADQETDDVAIVALARLDSDQARCAARLIVDLMELQAVVPQGVPHQYRKYAYWPAGAVRFASLTGLELPPAEEADAYRCRERWGNDVAQWVAAEPSEPVDWPLVEASLLVWVARVQGGTGADVWGSEIMTVSAETVGQDTLNRTAQRRGQLCANCKELAIPGESRCADCKAKRQAKARAERDAKAAQAA